MNFLKFLEENGISRRYARNAFAGFVIATIAPFIYHYDYFISSPSLHEIKSDELIQDYFLNLQYKNIQRFKIFNKGKKE